MGGFELGDSAHLRLTIIFVLYFMRHFTKKATADRKREEEIEPEVSDLRGGDIGESFPRGGVGMVALVLLRFIVHDHDNLFVAAEAVHSIGISLLIFKLTKEKTWLIVEPFTAHYVFAIGVARFLSCAHWVLQIVDTRGRLLVALGYRVYMGTDVPHLRNSANIHLGRLFNSIINSKR